MIDKAILITDVALEDRTILSVQTSERMDRDSSVIFKCYIFAVMLHSAVCLSVTFFYPSSRADRVSGVHWLDLGHTVWHLGHNLVSHHYLVLC